MSACPEFAHDRQWVMAHIRRVIVEYEPETHSPRVLRQLAHEYPDPFFKVAARELEAEHDLPANRAVAEVLLRYDSFFERLTNPVLCRTASAARLFRRLLAVDPTLDFRLARRLPGRNDSPHEKVLSGGHAARAIDILDQTSPGQRLLPLIAHLPNHADRRISSKAALFIGKRVNNPAWIEKQLAREDHRLRANAVEAFWGTKSEIAIRILKECAADGNPRVAGNALIGLHMAGCPCVTERVMTLSKSDQPGHRSAAAWVMGKLGSPDFVERLTALLRDGNPHVRSTAVRSLGEISRAETRRIEAEQAQAELRRREQETALSSQAEKPSAVQPEPDADGLNIPVPGFALRLDASHAQVLKK